MSVIDAARRLLGRSVVDLAEEVDAALAHLSLCQVAESQAAEALAIAQSETRAAEEAVGRTRDALFEQHPDLAPKGWGTPATHQQEDPVTAAHPDPSNPALLPGQDPSKFEVVEVDDADDPRFTAGSGVSPVPTSDTEPLPPIVWGEHDE